MLDGTGGSGFKSKDLLPILPSCDYQGSNDKVIEEVDSSISCWISFVASTGHPDGDRLLDRPRQDSDICELVVLPLIANVLL